MNVNIVNSFRKMIDVNTPIICIQDYDFVRIDEIIKEVTEGKKVLEWNPATGATNFKTKEQMGEFEPLDTFLQDKYVAEPVKPQELYLVLKDVQDYLDDPKVKSILHLMAQRRLYGPEYDTTVIIVSSNIQIPQEIEKYVSYLEIGFVNDEDEIRRLMWDYVGIVRTNKRLARAAHRIKTLRQEIRDYYFRYLVTPDTLELRNLAVCAELIVKSAQKRRESRGLHYTLDYPRMSKKVVQTVVPGFHG